MQKQESFEIQCGEKRSQKVWKIIVHTPEKNAAQQQADAARMGMLLYQLMQQIDEGQ